MQKQTNKQKTLNVAMNKWQINFKVLFTHMYIDLDTCQEIQHSTT